MELKESKFFGMAATIAAGILANPANAHMSIDQYTQQQAIASVINSLQQAILMTGCSIVADDDSE